MNPTKSLRTTAFVTIAAIASSLCFSACESTSEIGSSIVEDEAVIVIDSSFTVSGRSYLNPVVLSRTTTQLLGAVEAPGYGNISSEVVTQFMPSLTLDTTGVSVETVDSLKLIFVLNAGAFTGDSLAPVGLEVYPLTKQLKTPIYSNFDPQGYYDPTHKLGSVIYNVSNIGVPDSIKKEQYRAIYVDMPRSLAQDFFREYKEHPQTYSTPAEFAKYFPGLYFKNSYGSGRITRVASTSMVMYYHSNTKTDAGNDTTIHKYGAYFAVTPEIISNNDINLAISPEIQNRVNNGENILLAPAGLNIELVFPAREIAAAYRAGTKNGLGVINSLGFSIPVEQIANKYDIAPPTDVLLILKKDLDAFFLENKTTDDLTSFRATLSGANEYTFPDMRSYIVDIIKKDRITDEDVTFVLVPITVNTETNTDNSYYGFTSTYVTSITPYVTEPKMGKILLDKAKIKFIYTRQTTKL